MLLGSNPEPPCALMQHPQQHATFICCFLFLCLFPFSLPHSLNRLPPPLFLSFQVYFVVVTFFGGGDGREGPGKILQCSALSKAALTFSKSILGRLSLSMRADSGTTSQRCLIASSHMDASTWPSCTLRFRLGHDVEFPGILGYHVKVWVEASRPAPQGTTFTCTSVSSNGHSQLPRLSIWTAAFC